METPDTVQQSLIERFSEAGDAFGQFDVLLKLAAELKEMPEEKKQKEALVEGCQSQVWLYMRWDNETAGTGFHIEADSDTFMVRGVIRMLELMFEGCSADEILACPIRFVGETELRNVFDSKRQAGVAAITGLIRAFATKAKKES